MRNVTELLGSMRFAIALFVVLALASVIGTVLVQGAAYADYASQFGPFWADIFHALKLDAIYSAWWFVLILCTLVASVLVCVMRHMRRTKFSARHAGYLLAHGAIVLVCLGGLLDSSIAFDMQAWLLDKTPAQSDSDATDAMAARHRLPSSNLSFHGTVQIAPGQTVSTAIVRRADGLFVQDLPFSIWLDRFAVEDYATGMPRRFASDIVLIDSHNGKPVPARVEVNQPFEYDGVSVYQSGFQDGGSQLHITVWPMTGARAQGVPLTGVVGAASSLPAVIPGAAAQTIEWASLDVPRASASSSSFTADPGPSMQYVLRDASGQMREYESYMRPINVNGALMFITGVRMNPDEPFRYLRIPADSNGTLHEWMQLRAAWADPALRIEAARRFATRSVPAAQRALRQHVQQSAARVLALFAGVNVNVNANADADTDTHIDAAPQGGFQAIATLIRQTVPGSEQQKAAGLFWQMLDGATWDLWQVSRERAGEAPAPDNARTQRFVADAMNAMSDSFLYGAPVYCQLDAFTQVQASVFRVARAPGKKLVYPGCALLVVGIFMMLWRRPYHGPRGRQWLFSGLLVVGMAALSSSAIWLYHGHLARGGSVFVLRYFLSGQAAILWMSALFVLATLFYWLGLAARTQGPHRLAGGTIGARLAWAAVLMGATGMMVRWHESYLMGAGVAAGDGVCVSGREPVFIGPA
jgi:cytochrome c biogenesis protein ResB